MIIEAHGIHKSFGQLEVLKRGGLSPPLKARPSP